MPVSSIYICACDAKRSLNLEVTVQYSNSLIPTIVLIKVMKNMLTQLLKKLQYFVHMWLVGPVSDRKVNLVGTLGGQNVRKNPKKVTEKREFLRKTSFRPNRFFYMVVIQKLITTIEIFDFYENFFLNVYGSNFYEICQKRENLQ
ncbi:Uncharacterized protein FWK35_00016266, partial [Aphis craccivora]